MGYLAALGHSLFSCLVTGGHFRRKPKPLTQRWALSIWDCATVSVMGVCSRLGELKGREGMCLASAGSAGRRWDWRGKGHFPVQ